MQVKIGMKYNRIIINNYNMLNRVKFFSWELNGIKFI